MQISCMINDAKYIMGMQDTGFGVNMAERMTGLQIIAIVNN